MIWFGDSSTLTGAMRRERRPALPGKVEGVVVGSTDGAQPDRIETPETADRPASRRNSLRFMTRSPIETSGKAYVAPPRHSPHLLGPPILEVTKEIAMNRLVNHAPNQTER